MEKRLVWLWLMLKSQLRSGLVWLELVAMGVLLWLLSGISLPDADNTRVLLCSQESGLAQELMQELVASESVFSFEILEDEDALRQEILSGKAECGFIFLKGVEEQLEQGKTEDLIQYVVSSYTSKGAVARETVYQAFFRCYSEYLLTSQAAEIFAEQDQQDAIAFMLEQNRIYRSGQEVFDIQYQQVNVEQLVQEQDRSQVFPIPGVMAGVVLLHLLLLRGQDLWAGGSSYSRCLSVRERRKFMFWRYLAGGLLPAMAAVIFGKMLGSGGMILVEFARILVFLAIASVWVLLIGGCFRRKSTYFGWLCPLLAVNLLLAPVFFDLSTAIPAIRPLSWLTPVGIYLCLF